MENNYLVLKEAAKYLAVHPTTVRMWAKEGKIKYSTISNRGDMRFKKEDLDVMLKPVDKST